MVVSISNITPSLRPPRPFQIQRQQPLQNFLIAQVVGPAVRIEHRPVQPLVSQRQPRRPLIVQIGQCPFLQFLLRQAGRVGFGRGIVTYQPAQVNEIRKDP